MIKIYGKSKKEVVGFLIDKELNSSDVTVSGNCLDISVDISNGNYEDIIKLLENEYKGNIYAYKDIDLAEVFADLAITNNIKFSIAESLTGGMIADKLVGISGVSSVFTEGIVCYSNESKMKRLFVKGATLEQHGAVSKEVAREMVIGQNDYGVRLSMSTTGIAGPGGGTIDKPVGLTYIGTRFDDDIAVSRYVFQGDRLTVRKSAANVCIGNAIQMMKRHLNIKL